MKDSRAVPTRLLWIATKSPWPPVDGGRLLLLESLKALREAGAEVNLVAPIASAELEEAEAALAGHCRPALVAARARSRGGSALRAGLGGGAWSVVRHDSAPVRYEVERQLANGRFDLVVAEQLQAFRQSRPAESAGLARILRAQNVESDLWRQLAAASRGPKRALLAAEARKLEAAERAAVREAALTVALSRDDAVKLETLAALATPAGWRGRVETIAPPFPLDLPAAAERLAGDPAVVVFGSAGWEPNRRAAASFASAIWPRIAAEISGARLHWFGPEAPRAAGVVAHPAPADSREAYAPGSILALPIDLASGVRIRILEAWARGVAVVATPAAASGLAATDGQELLLASTPGEFAAAISRLRSEPGLAGRLVASGRERLAADHAPRRFAERFLESCATIVAQRAGRR